LSTEASAIDHRRRRLALVRFLRWGLPAVAVLAVAGVAGQIAWNAVTVAVAARPAADSAVSMNKPTFAGQGRDGSHYQVTAASGVRDAKDEKLIHLVSPVITVTKAGQQTNHTTAQRGLFREDDHTLHLQDNVQVEQTGGYKFATNDATIDTNTGQVLGQTIKGNGPSGAVQSNSYAVTDKGDRMVFKGGVRARLNEH
jgi:lipopolysaccharide export system protein LptC